VSGSDSRGSDGYATYDYPAVGHARNNSHLRPHSQPSIGKEAITALPTRQVGETLIIVLLTGESIRSSDRYGIEW
jgi:hypothetical protein